MKKITANISLSLDGVTQAPGRPDEDRRGGFVHGGRAAPYFDPVAAQAGGDSIANAPALLFGRITYQDFYSVWPARKGEMFSEVLRNAQKYVASKSLAAPLP